VKKFKFVLALVSVLSVGAVSAPVSAAAFNAGEFTIGGAVGLGYTAGSIPVSVNAEYGFNKNIGIGGLIGYYSYSSGYNLLGNDYSWKYTVIPVGVTAAWHFDIGNPNIDLAVGLYLGYHIHSFTYTINGVTSTLGSSAAATSGLGFGGYANARYYFNKHLAIKARAGYGFSIIDVGIDYRL